MKFILLFMSLCMTFTIKAQTATISVDIKNSKVKEVAFLNNDYSKASVMFEERYFSKPLSMGKAMHTFSLTMPTNARLYWEDDSTKQHEYEFYLSPGDDIHFFVDMNELSKITVTGKGRENNQQLAQEIKHHIELEQYQKDSLPNDVFAAILKQDSANRTVLKRYIQLYNPSKAFINDYKLFIQYFPVWEYIEFKGEQKFHARESFERNKKQWDRIEDSLIRKNSLNDTNALRIPSFAYFLPMYVSRIKENLWSEAHTSPIQFFEQWYNADEKTGRKIFQDDMENDLRERIIKKYFTGKTEEFLYATLFEWARRGKRDNIPQIYEHFKQRFPQSQYIPYIEPFVAEVKKQESRPLTSDMVMIQNSDSLKTFEDVLTLVKGKNVLLDMWGTWCSPCREHLQDNTAIIKEHFKNKGLDYLYIANKDLGNAEKWKKLIPYYNLTGLNILAGTELTNDIMKTVKGVSYPTYVLIKKDGSFELLTKTRILIKREDLIKQVDDLLNKNL